MTSEIAPCLQVSATGCMIGAMMLRLPIAFLLALASSGCSYRYELRAVVINGRLAFIVDPDSRSSPSCFNDIDVIARGDERATPSPGDAQGQVRSGTFWHERFDYDCVDKFPILYGQQFKGKPNPLGQAPEAVAAKPLRIGVAYEVTTTTGATGYGSGAFKILPDRRVINVPPPPFADPSDDLQLNTRTSTSAARKKTLTHSSPAKAGEG